MQQLRPLSSLSALTLADATADASSTRSAFQFSDALESVCMLDDVSDAVMSSKRDGDDLPDIMSSKRDQVQQFRIPNEPAASAVAAHANHARRTLRVVRNDAEGYSASLRPDLPPAQLFSREHAALAFNAFAAGFAITFLRYAFRPLLVAYLSMHHRNQFMSARYLLEWPGALAVVVGLWSDCVPLSGHRRKPYMVLGWLTSFFMFTGVVIVTLLSPAKILLFVDDHKRGEAVATSDLETYPSQFAVLYVTFGVLGALGLQVAYVVSLALTVELAQREPLYKRGRLQASYLLLFYVAAMLAQFFVSKVLFPTEDDDSEPLRSTITMGEAGVVLSTCSVIAFPVMLFFLKDERVLPREPQGSSCKALLTLLQERTKELFEFCQQQVVYRVVLFVCGIVLVLGLYNQNLRDAVAVWSGITPQKALNVQVGQNACIVLGIALWRLWLVNTSWQRLVLVGVCFYVLCCATLTMPTVYAWVRRDWFFFVLTALLEVPKGWLKLYAVVPATEIAEAGREGVTVGLIFSFQWLVYIAANTLSTMLSHVIGTNVTKTQVLADSAETRSAVFTAAAVYYMINLSSILLASMLPQQKIAAQQMRVFGKRTRAMGFIIAIGFAVLLVYCLVANIVAIQASS